MIKVSAFEMGLIREISHGLALVKRPYQQLAERLGASENDVIDGINRIRIRGELKRFGVVVRHRKLGYRANGMVVWDVADERVGEIGHCMSQYPFVTLCYRRPRRPPVWPYNLFCMIHGQNHDEVIQQTALIAQECGLTDIDHQILFSKRCFKQRGAVYRRQPPVPEELSDEPVTG